MSEPIKGMVRELSEMPWKDRDTGNAITLYSFQIQDNNMWFRTGETPHTIKVGDAISFVANRQQVLPSSIKQISAGDVPTEGKVTAPRKGKAPMGRNDYWEAKDVYDKAIRQPCIAYQSARKDATAIVVAALSNDVLALGQKKADRLGILIGMVEEVTQTFYDKYVEFEGGLDND